MKILVAEDDKNTLSYLSKGLSQSGFAVECAQDGEIASHLLDTVEFDIVILDVMLPGKTGWEVCDALRKSGKLTPVLFLTARDQVQDRLKGFELGADDYLVKPFAFSELLHRIREILRRSSNVRSDTIQIADLEVDFVRHKATRGGKVLNLRPKEFALLGLLLRRSGEVLSRTFIAEQIWDINFAGETNVVDVQVSRLRIVVDDPFPKKLIHSVRGIGYVLENRD